MAKILKLLILFCTKFHKLFDELMKGSYRAC